MINFCRLFSLFLLFFSGAAIGSSVPNDALVQQLVDRALALKLQNSNSWHALVHYKPDGLFKNWTSQADDTAFFLSVDGKYNPKAELESTIRAFFSPTGEDLNQHPQCRFPARYHWLKNTLNLNSQQLPAIDCDELNQWFDTLRPGSLTLVFPAAYINSPSSMFGHTLMRVNPDDFRKDKPLAAYALNYAANANETDNALVFTIKGLIGGYPGIFSIVPYHEKLKEYSDIENRDIWEYDLAFTHEEVTQIMRHAWEVRKIRFDYFFFTENCSYHMLSLMDVARPELNLTAPFTHRAVPADTVRAVWDAGLVKNTTYRPSGTKVLSQHANQLDENENQQVIEIVSGKIKVNQATREMEPEQKARVYEQAYDYARFLSSANPEVRDQRAAINWQLLAERSKIPLEDVWNPIEIPKVRPDQGHGSSRVVIGLGLYDDEDYLDFHMRPSYHDLMDPPLGYSNGAQINFFDLNLRYFIDKQKLQFEKLTIINVLSVSPRNQYFDPISWGVDFGVENQPSLSGHLNALQLIANGGLTYPIFEGYNLSILGEANIRASDNYNKGYSAGVGLKIELVTQNENWSMLLGMKEIHFEAGENNLHRQYSAGLSYHKSVSNSFRLNLTRSLDYRNSVDDVQLAWHHYF